MSIYLDNNATTPLDERVLEAMLPWLRRVGNPSSVHAPGRAARAAIDRAREQVAELVNAHPGQVLFTGGGTESNNLALKGAAANLAPGALAVSRIEHASLLGPARALERRGWRLDYLDVDGDSRLVADGTARTFAADTRLVSVMWANNENGVIQDVPALAARARAAGALVHSDAAQAAGKIALDFAASGLHMMTLSAHKMYGPIGVGALVRDRAVELEALLHGGGQEQGLRGGTENTAAIVGFGAAAELARAELAPRQARLRELRELLEVGLAGLEGVEIVARAAERLPNTVQVLVAGIDGETLLMNLDQAGVALSSGSACASGAGEPSHVLTAMGLERERARGAIRVSLGTRNTRQDVAGFLAALGAQLATLAAMRGASVAAW